MLPHRALAALCTGTLALAQSPTATIDQPRQLPSLVIGDCQAEWSAPAGACIGTLSAKAVLLRHRDLRLGGAAARLSVAPVLDGGGSGLRVALRF